MGVTRAAALALLLLVAGLAPGAAAANDDGSGTDAPDGRNGAWTVAEGWVNGTVSVFDEDWYRIEVPDGQALVLSSLASSGTIHIGVEEEDGFSLADLTDGETVTLGSSTGALLIHLSMDIGEARYWVELDLVDVPDQDDAGTGGDAGNHWPHATNVTGNSFEGVVGQGPWDPGDWFAVPLPTDHWVEVRFKVPRASALVEVRSATGELLGRAESSWGSWATVRAAPGTSQVLLGVVQPRSGLPYELQVATTPRPDVSVTELTVQGTGLERTVSFTLSNDGPGPLVDGWLWAWTRHTDRPGDRDRVLLNEPLDLAPLSSRSFTVAWDTVGEVGDGTLYVWAQTRFDLNASDDLASTDVTVLTGGAGHGVDLLNHHAATQLLYAHGSLTTHRDGSGTGIEASAGPGNADLWAEAGISPAGDPDGQVRACSYTGPDQCAIAPLPPGVGS